MLSGRRARSSVAAVTSQSAAALLGAIWLLLAACAPAAPPWELPAPLTPLALSAERVGEGRALATLVPDDSPQVWLGESDYTHYPAEFGGLYVVGTVVNEGHAPALVDLLGILADEQFRAIDLARYNFVALPAAQPGEPYPFKLVLDPEGEDWTEVAVEAHARLFPQGSAYTPYFELEPTKVQSDLAADDRFAVRGRITNQGVQRAHDVRVVVIAYDQEGKVVDIADHRTGGGVLAPGESVPFLVEFYYLDHIPASHRIVTQGIVVR